MTLNIGKEVAALERMTVGELRERYAELFDETTPARKPHVAYPPHHLADTVAGARCPVRTRPPPGRRTGQRR